MKKFFAVFLVSIFALAACEKEVSIEGGGNGGGSNIIGTNCRISKIASNDSASGVSLGAITAVINSSDKLTDITLFDSLNNTLEYNAQPIYQNDTVNINVYEYFVLNTATQRVEKFHGRLDLTDPASPEIDVLYSYDASGYLIKKSYEYSALPGLPYSETNYTYASGNLVKMENIDLFTTDVVADAVLQYASLVPVNFLYIFPDEIKNTHFNQFLNFGRRNVNAIAAMKVRYYDPLSGIVTDSLVSTFSNYELSIDKYVLRCNMKGDDQPSLPAVEGKLSFSYKCK